MHGKKKKNIKKFIDSLILGNAAFESPCYILYAALYLGVCLAITF